MNTSRPGYYLTEREKQICRLVMKRCHNKLIADKLALSVNTVRVHLSNIYQRFSLSGKPDMILFLAGDSKLLD